MWASSWPGEKCKNDFGAWVQRMKSALKAFAKLFIGDGKKLFRSEWSNNTKYTYIKVDNLFE
jgi:predicted TIM-barrel fold metal-dependent hydrolase